MPRIRPGRGMGPNHVVFKPFSQSRVADARPPQRSRPEHRRHALREHRCVLAVHHRCDNVRCAHHGPAGFARGRRGLFHPPNNGAVLARVSPRELGSANGFFTTARNFDQVLGTVLAAGLLDQGLKSAGVVARLGRDSGALDEVQYLSAYVHSQAHSFRVAALLALVGAVISALRGGAVARKTDRKQIGGPAPHC